MLENHARFRASAPPAAADDLQRAACEAVAAIVEAGARSLTAQPWRVRRVIGGADTLSFDELAARVAQRGCAARPSDPNPAIALAQLNRALHSPSFRAAWADWRNGASADSQPAYDGALCE